ncbi:GNAT family N-acetyltransferase [Marivita sp. GX14005]|uniref:GNAT family N-acetyltransferase n=1 Tax=Marivita sp. GX14005 TaxID=2942276 RepID=UPI0020188B1B|nr:GNAT family N-acetyltransferase [Marivita sp. GX14005]MCL3880967.1 GNAT family N-acetyltransferase [Marivita sp. GX14005]
MDLDIQLDFAQTEPDRVEMTDILTEYFTQIRERLMASGGPRFSISDYVQTALDEMDSFLPPRGATVLARDSSGFLLGCAFVRMIDAERAELRRLYVRDLARGLGLGRRLIEMRIDKAREMGATTVYSDAVRDNSAILSLYDRLGFTDSERYESSTIPPALTPYLVYRKLMLPAAETG